MNKKIKTFITFACIFSITLFITHYLGNKTKNVDYTDIQSVTEPEETVSETVNTIDGVSSPITFTPETTVPSFTVPQTQTNTVEQEEPKTEAVNQKAFSGISKYTNEDFSFEYLSSWKPTDSAENSEIDFLINGRNAMFSVVKESVPTDFTVQDYVNSTKKTLQEKENSTITSIQSVSHNSIEGSCIIYEVVNEENTSVVNEFVTIHNNTIYVFTYYTDFAKYENYLTEYNNLLDSLVFVN